MVRGEGDAVPDVSLFQLDGGSVRALGSGELLRGRRVVVFALPGAFTPTCSSQHLPRFEELAPSLRAQGVDDILCISVNDPFVLEEWQRNQGLRQVRLLSDGNGEFTAAMGLLLDQHDLGLGQRSRRYSMLVNNGVIEKLLLEPEESGDPYTVSDADTMLDHLASGAARPPRIALLSKPGCPYCAKARALLEEHHLPFEDIALNDAIRARVIGAIAGASTTPQVFIDGTRIGGSEELERYLSER